MEVQKLLQQRKTRGYDMAQKGKVIQKDGRWFVQSQSNPKRNYEVILNLEGNTCTCEDFTGRGMVCKHQFAVEFVIKKTTNKDGLTTITATQKKVSYPQNWKAYNTATIQQKELYLKLLNDLCNTIEEPAYSFGRPRMKLRDMVFGSALKVYSTFSLRRFSTDMKGAQSKGYVEKIPYFSTIARYMESPALTPILNELITISALPLKSVESVFGIDATGFSPSKFSRWFSHKYGKTMDRKIWYKLHVVNGSATHIITACEVTSQYVSDMNQLSGLIEETHKNFNITELSADKGYLSDNNYLYLNKLGITGYIPFRSNTSPINEEQSKRYHSDVWRNAYNYFTMNQASFLEHYHQRSNTETVMHMVKSKFGDFVRSKNEIACRNEILLKVLCHNLCVLIQEMFELGIKPEFIMGK